MCCADDDFFMQLDRLMDASTDEVNDVCGGAEENPSEGSEWSEEGNGNGEGQETAKPVVEEDCTEFEDVIGMKTSDFMRKRFRSEDVAYEFYKRFGKSHGFGV
ncbi:hypothetical protein PIB30_043863 [Stylosanthes scabra]|uniref:Uncharacterized protein n=1 Tax=Stylosanthes scabra TaxID=79078 RepID=A0ABU6QF90_9FABA|nr:hypothetical protein [Stylosanthes scabra]